MNDDPRTLPERLRQAAVVTASNDDVAQSSPEARARYIARRDVMRDAADEIERLAPMSRPDALLQRAAELVGEPGGSYVLLLRADVATLLAWVHEMERGPWVAGEIDESAR
jgi:hypothetical protein